MTALLRADWLRRLSSALIAHSSSWWRPTQSGLRYHLADWIDRLQGRHSLAPPRILRQVGNGDFERIGLEFKRHLIEQAGLTPQSRVLDLGCGVGRVAIALIPYLTTEGEYLGLDISRHQIRWCETRIGARHPNFRFLHADVFSRYYNPRARTLAREYRLPLQQQEFDLVFLVSVFTHMLCADIQQYLHESSRVLKPGGRLLATFFLLNPGSRAALQTGRAHLRFEAAEANEVFLNPRVPEHAVAVDEAWLRQALQSAGLVLEAIHPGAWAGREPALSYQDIVVARKP